MPSITFHGAARTVTGSKYIVSANSTAIMLDCGLFQGEKEQRVLNWAEPLFDPREVHALVLTHTHLDHVGYLPRLVKLGFRGKVYATPATCDLAEIMLLDSAHIQEEDTAYYRRHGLSRHADPQPLYDSQDAKRALELFAPTPRGKWIKIDNTFEFRFSGAGHLLGACSVEMSVRENKKESTILFSGDLGRYGMPFVRDPEAPVACDYLVMESTYGGRQHSKIDPLDTLRDVILRTYNRGGIVLIPAFAVGRSQQLIYMLRTLEERGSIPKLPTHIDSPMAIDATEIYCKYEHDHGIPLSQLEGESCVLLGPHFEFHASREESKKLNGLHGPAVIISSSGMLTGGRILHHISRLAPDNKNTVLFAGYQAAGTRGRDMLEGRREIKIYGQLIPVNAEVVALDGLSGHGDHDELLRWAAGLNDPPQKVFLTHGEYSAALALGEALRERAAWDITIPERGEKFSW